MKSARTTSARTTSAVSIFVGALLIANVEKAIRSVMLFVIGLIATGKPDTFLQKNRYDFALQQFVGFCRSWWPVAGIIGIPVFLISLIRSLILESREKE